MTGLRTLLASLLGLVALTAAQEAPEVPEPPWLEGVELFPTYTEGAGLIFERRCVTCHRPGGVGGLSFVSLSDIRRRAARTQASMKDVIGLRMMPPWPPDPAVGAFANDPRLSRREIEILERWIDAGYPAGDASLEMGREWFDGWSIGKPDAVFEIAGGAVPADPENGVVELTVRTDFPEDRLVIAAEALPSDPSGGVVAVDAGPLGTYRPGRSWVRHLPGTGWSLPAGAEVPVRVRYEKPRVGRPVLEGKLGVIFADDPASAGDRLRDARMRAPAFRLAAGQGDLEVRARFEFPSAGKIHSLTPTMRWRGVSVEYTATFPDGRVERLLSIPDWDPKRVYRYQLRTPLPAPEGTVVEAVAHFDNSLDNVRNPDPFSDVESESGAEMLEGWLGYSLDEDR